MTEDKPDKTVHLMPIKLPGDTADGGLDIVTYYADFGRPYKEWIKLQSRSIKEAMPEARRVLLTPNCIDLVTSFDKLVMMDFEPQWNQLMFDRCLAHVRWARGTVRRTIYCDCDLQFRHQPEFDGSFDIGLLWRKAKADQPVNSSMILAEPGFPEFWQKFADVVINVPKSIRGWWCDQISLALLIGVCHEAGDIIQIGDARVKLLDARACCDTPDQISEDAWAVHRKGPIKGEWFEDLYTATDQSGGMSSADLCYSTGTR